MSVNKVILVGRLGQNPEVKYAASGNAVANFSIATSENWTDKQGQKQERTEWHRIVVWGKLAELCGQYLAKGRQAYIEGRLQTRQWQDKEGQTRYTTEVQAQTVQFLGGAANTTSDAGAGMGAPSSRGQSPAGASAGGSMGFGAPSTGGGFQDPPAFTEDDIPF